MSLIRHMIWHKEPSTLKESLRRFTFGSQCQVWDGLSTSRGELAAFGVDDAPASRIWIAWIWRCLIKPASDTFTGNTFNKWVLDNPEDLRSKFSYPYRDYCFQPENKKAGWILRAKLRFTSGHALFEPGSEKVGKGYIRFYLPSDPSNIRKPE